MRLFLFVFLQTAGCQSLGRRGLGKTLFLRQPLPHYWPLVMRTVTSASKALSFRICYVRPCGASSSAPNLPVNAQFKTCARVNTHAGAIIKIAMVFQTFIHGINSECRQIVNFKIRINLWNQVFNGIALIFDSLFGNVKNGVLGLQGNITILGCIPKRMSYL